MPNPFLITEIKSAFNDPTGMNPYAMESIAAEQSTGLRASLINAAGSNPDEAARALRLSRETSTPYAAVKDNLPQVQQGAQLDEYERMLRGSPAAQAFMRRPEMAQVAQDDVSTLTGVERAIRAFMTGGPRRLAAADPRVMTSTEANAAVRRAKDLNPALDDDAARLLALQGVRIDNTSALVGPVRGPAPSTGSVISGLASAARRMPEVFDAGLGYIASDILGIDPAPYRNRLRAAETAEQATAPEFQTSTGKGLYGGGTSIIQNSPAIALSLLTGTTAPGLALVGVGTGVPAYAKYRERGAGKGMAALGGGAEAAIEVGTELLPMGFLVNKLGKVGAGDFIKGLLARELPTEQIATLAQDAVDTAIANPDKTWTQYFAERPDAAYQTLLATLVQSGAMGAVHTASKRLLPEATAAAQAEQHAVAVADFAKLAEASKLRARDPESFTQFVQQVTDGGATPTEFYVDGETLANTLNQSGITMERLMRVAPLVAAQLTAANYVPGADIRVPVAEAAAAGPEIITPLIDHFRATPDAMSRAEAQEYLRTEGDRIKEYVDSALTEHADAAAFSQQVQQLKDGFKAQLDAAGKFRPEVNEAYATLMGNFYGAQAVRAGLSPQELLDRYQLNLTAKDAKSSRSRQVLEQAAIVKVKEEIRGLVAQSKEKGNASKRVKVAPVPAWLVAEGKKRGFDFTGYAHAIDSSAVRHTLNKHADPAKEQARGQVAVTEADFELIPDLVASPDHVVFGTQNRLGKDQVVYLKRLEDGSTLYLEEVRTGKKELAAVSMRKYPATMNAESIVSTLDPNAQGDGGHEVIVLSDPAGSNTLEQGPRGTLTFATNIASAPSTIALLADADLSTFIHESGHFFLEVQADLAVRIQTAIAAEDQTQEPVSEAERGIVADMESILSWFGITADADGSALDRWAQMSLEEKREHHETFARGFERYVLEGKAPSQDLQPIFSRFRAWLLSVYKTLTGLNVKLTDDVREVMGRMLASDEAISAAQAAREMGPLFESSEQAGMTLEEYAQYQSLGARATDAAAAELDGKLLKDMKWLSRARDKAIKARQAEVDALRKETEREVRAEVMSTSVYRAWAFLTGKTERSQAQGEAASGEEVDNIFTAIAKLGGLNRAEVQSQWGLDPKEKLSSGVFGSPVVRKTGGLSIDMMGERLVELGYLLPDEHGKADLAKFEALFDDQRRGIDQFSIARQMGGERAAQSLDLPEVASGRLNTQDMKRMFGDEKDATWRILSERRMTAPDGIHPDIVAETFEFESGQQLINTLVRTPPPAEVIAELTDQRMLERHGDIGSDEDLSRAADVAVHNELRARVIAAELKALEKAGKVRATGDSLISRSTVDVMATAARNYAAQVVARVQIKNLRPGQYAAAEARSAKLAMQALGDTQEAALHKRNQLVNNYAAKAAYEAQAEVRKGVEFFRKVTTGARDKVSQKRDWDVVQAMRAILADYGIGTRGEAAQKYLEAVERNDPEMHKVLRDRVDTLTNNARPLAELTVEEFRGLQEEIAALWHLAKRSRQMEVDGKLISIEAAKIPLVARLEDIGVPKRVPGEGRAVTDAERRLTGLRTLRAALRRVESWVGAKDGGEGIGPFRQYIWQPVKEAADRYRADKAWYLRRYRDLLGALDVGEARIDAPELGYTFGYSRGGSGKAEILHALLHTGNPSNKRKMLLGREWASVHDVTGELDTRRWDAFVRRMIDTGVLTKADFDFAQGVWDLLEDMKPLAQKTHRDVFGAYFDEVTAEGFSNEFGTYRGGYVPAMMDPEVVKDAATRALQESENQTLAYAFPATNKGFTKARVEINRPLLLDLRSLATHIDKVLLFSHLERPIRDVRKLLASAEVSEPLHRIDPTAFDGLLTPWLNRAARQTVETRVPGDNNMLRFFSKMRSRAGMAAMFANVSNAAQQITGLSIAAVKVPPKHLVSAMAEYVMAPRQTARAVAEASPYMAGRMDNEVAQMTDAINDILLNPSVYEQAQVWTAKHAYFLQSAVDNVIGPVVWTGAYNRALEAGHGDRDAIRLADAAVRETQGSTLPEDVSRIETGHPFVRMFTQFAGYFNMQANLMGTEFAKAQHGLGLRQGVGRGLYVFTLGFLAPAMLSELIVQAFRGGPEDEDKDGSTLDDWLMAVLVMGNVRAGLAMVPGAGQIANASINTWNKKPYDDRISTAPAVSMIESAAAAPHSVYKAIEGEGSARKAIRDVATLIAMSVGLPATAIARPLGYLADVAQDKTKPTGPVDAARGAVTGVSSPESKGR